MTGKTTSAQRDRERAVLAAVERFAPLRRLGWAFLLAWVFCVFYTNAVSGYTGAKASTLAVGAGWDLFFTGLPVSMSVVMLVLIVVLEKKTVSLGYTLPKQLTKKWKIDNARVFVAGQNLDSPNQQYSKKEIDDFRII